MSFPMVTSINDGIDKDKYLAVAIELAYRTIDALATMAKGCGTWGTHVQIWLTQGIQTNLDRPF